MAKFSLEVKASAEKELDALDDASFKRIDAKIQALADDPRPRGCKKLRGHNDLWRVRIGGYRVVYSITGPSKTVSILRVAHRAKVYGP